MIAMPRNQIPSPSAGVSTTSSRNVAITVITVSLAMVTCSATAVASDWPAYRRDARRSAVSPDTLDFPLHQAWHHTSDHAPRPAFPDPLSHPTKLDFAYTGDHSEPVLLDFDYAYHPVAAGGRVFFGSSADDAVRCLSLSSGKLEWVFVTGAPVRFAPQVVGERLYVASDDGFVYCLATSNGALQWQFRAAPSARQLVGNARMISRWPLRTGVLVLDGTVYVTAGMWPAEGIYVYALDAETGAIRWVNDTSGTLNQRTANPGAYAIAGVAPTGYLLADRGALAVPTGRSIPASYALPDGTLLGSVAPSYQNRKGGPATCIDLHGSLIFGYPRERLTGTAYSVHYAYRLPAMQAYATIRADRLVIDKLAYVTVDDLIRCYQADSRYRKVTVQWQADCPSKQVHALALAANALLMGVDNRVVARDPESGVILWQQNNLDGYVQSLAVVDQTLLVATDAGSIYSFATSAVDTADTSTTGRALSATAAAARAATTTLPDGLRAVLQANGIQRGLALVIGQPDVALATQLAANTQLQVVHLMHNAQALQAARRNLLATTISGQGQVSLQATNGDQPLPFADHAFNIIVATGDVVSKRAAQLHRALHPGGGILYIQRPDAHADAVWQHADKDRLGTMTALPTKASVEATAYRCGKLPGALDWNSTTTRDERVKWPLELLWFGGPGSKRTGSGSRAPIAAGGRNFVVGKNHLIALDAYNGTELWAKPLPYLYRNIGRLKRTPGPVNPWLTHSISADDDSAYLNFGHVVYTLDADSGEQKAVHGEFPVAESFVLSDRPKWILNHFQKPDSRATQAVTTKANRPAGSIQLTELAGGRSLSVTLKLAADVEITETVYWELFLDVRPQQQRHALYQPGIFHLIARPASGQLESGIGPVHPDVNLSVLDDGREMTLTMAIDQLQQLGGYALLPEFSFAAALNHEAAPDQKVMAGGRRYLRWELFADPFAYAFNNGWARILRDEEANTFSPLQLAGLDALPAQAFRGGRIGGVGRRGGSVVSLAGERVNPLSLEADGLEYNRGKGCGLPVSAESLHVLRSGTLAFYDLDDDSGMRYFGGVRPSCTVSAVPAQGLVFAAEGSSGCSCNYNFKTTLALAPAAQRRQEDWAMFMAPLSPGALLRSGRFNLGSPGDRRDEAGGLWLQYPRAPTLANRSMPVPVKLSGDQLEPYRVNADRVPIAGTDRPWLYASGFEGIEGLQVQLFMSDKEGVAVFPADPPALDARLNDPAWERRYAVPAGTGSSLLLAHDDKSLHVAYEVVPPVDRRGKRLAWNKQGDGLASFRFGLDEPSDDAEVWQEDSLEFLVSDTTLATILHFGVGISGGRYDGEWTTKSKQETAAYAGRWTGAVEVTAEKAVAEFSIPWQTLQAAGLDLDNLVIRARTKKPLARQPHITHGFRPVLLQGVTAEPKRYHVTLHFAELAELAAGERVFDIQLQGKTVLPAFDPVVAAGGTHRAVARVFKNVRADRALEIHLIPGDTTTHLPILAAIEIMLAP